MGYVYKYVLNGEVIYIGKTKNLTQRIGAHGCNGDNIDEAFWEDIKASDIYVKAVDGDLATDLLETCLINKYAPKCNKAKIINGYSDLGIDVRDADTGFSPYSPNGHYVSAGYITPSQYKALVREMDTLEEEYRKLSGEYDDVLNRCSELADECNALKEKCRLTDARKKEIRDSETERIANCINSALMEMLTSHRRMVVDNQDAWMLEGERKCFRKLIGLLAHIMPLNPDLIVKCGKGVCL